MTLEGWIFMVGLRVFDVGALILWLVWFFRLRDDDDDEDGGDDDFRGDGGDAPPPTGPGGRELPHPDAEPWPQRRRDHAGDRPPADAPARRVPARPERTPEPQRSRRARAGLDPRRTGTTTRR
jgi:hypothetical protein